MGSNYIHYDVWDKLLLDRRQRWNRLGMDKEFHATFYNGCNYWYMLGFKLNHIRVKGRPMYIDEGQDTDHNVVRDCVLYYF